MKALPALLTCLILSTLSGCKQSRVVDNIEIIERGIYKAGVVKWIKDDRVSGGKRTLVGPAVLVKETDEIPAVAGLQFGFRFKIHGAPKGNVIDLAIVTLYPEPGLKDPTRGSPLMTDKYSVRSVIGTVSHTGYHLNKDWELVPGVWRFQLWYSGKMYAEQRFTVVGQGE